MFYLADDLLLQSSSLSSFLYTQVTRQVFRSGTMATDFIRSINSNGWFSS